LREGFLVAGDLAPAKHIP
jgi:transposase